MIIVIEIVGVLFLIVVLAMLIKLNRRSRSVRPGDERFRKVGPGEVRHGEKPRATGID